MYNYESENNRERQYFRELRRELSPAEREFYEQELEHSKQHHETMKQLIAEMPELYEKPILFIDATDKGTTGSDFFTSLNPELLDYLMLIQTGKPFPKDSKDFNYKNFTAQTFSYMFGFDYPDKRFQVIRTVDKDAVTPESLDQYSLVIGSGGELNHVNTQEEYLDQMSRLKPLLKNVLQSNIPFFMTCATHQIMGQVAFELEGKEELHVEQMINDDGEPQTESGIVELRLTDTSQNNKAVAFLPENFLVMSNHGEYLPELPPNSSSLANNEFQGKTIATQLIEYNGGQGLGIQAHPEISPVVMYARFRLSRALAAWDGKDLADFPEIDTRPTWQAREGLFPYVVGLINSEKTTMTHVA